jgi:hypothetical protein
MANSYTFPTPGSSVSAGTPSPKTSSYKENEADNAPEQDSPFLGRNAMEDELSSMMEIKRIHAEFLRNSANETFST